MAFKTQASSEQLSFKMQKIVYGSCTNLLDFLHGAHGVYLPPTWNPYKLLLLSEYEHALGSESTWHPKIIS